ncbi:hypothetical protein C8R44DRAFT_749653 [Mycena epipterygia]|nr:hypothetical protein C8R44DRAFT_749653 [Mycena epipterygia]
MSALDPRVGRPPPTPRVGYPYRWTPLLFLKLSAEEVLDWQKDVHIPGKATCPKCGKLFVNCESERKKGDKQAALKKGNGSMKSWLTTKVKEIIPSTVKPPALVHADGPSSATRRPPSEISSPHHAIHISLSSVTTPRAIELLNQLRAKIKLLPSTVPIADQTNPLSVFSEDSAAYLSETIPANELWERLSQVFHGAFGYAMGLDERTKMIQHGMYGLDGASRFLIISPGVVVVRKRPVIPVTKPRPNTSHAHGSDELSQGFHS